MLEYYCSVNKIGYIPLYKDLNLANSNGEKTSWPYDGHFNGYGTKIFAESMYRWLQNNGVGRSLNNWPSLFNKNFLTNLITVSDLRQSDRLFLALIDTIRNERLRKSN